MTTTTAPATRLTYAERTALYSAARPEVITNDRPARRIPPKTRRHSVKHRAHR